MNAHKERCRPPAKGTTHRRTPMRLWVSIGFDDETFADIRAIALQRNISFNRTVRDLVELGLETHKLDMIEGRP